MKAEKDNLSRRNFLEKLAIAGVGGTAGFGWSTPLSAGKAQITPHSDNRPGLSPAEEKITLHVFSKHLQFLNYNDMAQAAAEAGFDGVDLAVRPKGHVLPEKVQQDLVLATEAIRNQGLLALMMTTAINNAADGTQQQIIKSAAEAGIKYYRTDWLWYEDKPEVEENLEKFEQQLGALAALNEQHKIIGDYQNHAAFNGYPLGGPVWDLALVLNQVQSHWLGSQYDIRHATVEGGTSWPLGLKFIHPHIHTLVVKDFKWEMKEGKWLITDTPIGDGMVDFPKFFGLLKELQIKAPVSVHFEYEMPEHNPGLSATEKRQQTIKIMRKNVNALRNYIKEAGL